MRGNEVIIVHPSGGKDRFGDPLPGGEDIVVPGCLIWPRSLSGDLGREENERGETVIVGLSVFAPPDTPIRAVDEITARGERWEVEGEVGDYRSAAGVKRGVMVGLKKVSG